MVAGRLTLILLAVVALLQIPNSESFATRNLDLRLERLEGGPSILSLPIEKQALGNLRRSKWNNLNFLKVFREKSRTSVDFQEHHDERRLRWRRVLTVFHQTLMSLLKSRVARLFACWMVVMVGQFSLALSPATATTTSSVGMLMQTTGGPALSTGTSTAAKMTVATATRALRSLNLPAAAGVVAVAVLGGGLVGKKFVPAEEVKEDGNVLQLTRQTKEEEQEEGYVLQLTRQTKSAHEVEREREQEIRRKELEIRRKEEAEMRKNKEAGERLLQQTLSRYEAPVAVAPPVVEEEVTVAVEEEVVVEVEEEVIPIVTAPEPGLIEEEVVEVVLQEPVVDDNVAVVASSVSLDPELDQKRKELVETMVGFVGMIITVISVFGYYG